MRAGRGWRRPLPDTTTLARRAAYAGISLPAVADWLVGDVTLRDILHLRTGDVLELPSESDWPKRVSIYPARPCFVGTAGVREGKVAVRLDRRVRGKRGFGGGDGALSRPFSRNRAAVGPDVATQ